ncbi:hypothetical protein ACFYR1_46630 [Streptomyces canus]|uniref:hypothetical protein n=1 Tax=Streptomyces canus TaxID=58343 RepID=UPI0036CD67A9
MGEPDSASRRVVDAALTLLSATRMLTFPLLAGGQVVIAAAVPHASHAVLELQEHWDAHDTATNILALSSRTVLQSWYDALEEEGADQPLRPLRDVARLLSGCLAHEYYVRRIRSASDALGHESLEQRRDALAEQLLEFTPRDVFTESPNESVVAELVSYYYPHWDRRYFAFHSPWDNFRLAGR